MFLGFGLVDRGAERIVPPSGFTMTLTVFSAAAMAFLAVFVAGVSGGAERAAAAWTESLAGTATVHMPVTGEDAEALVAAVQAVLDQTPGIESAAPLRAEEQAALLAPWFGDESPLDIMNFPVIFEVTLTDEGPDRDELIRRLNDTAPGAVFDDHGQWREPVLAAAGRLQGLARLSLGLIAAITASVIALAASSSLAANAKVIDVLRLVGATDSFITRLFVRRFTVRALAGAAAGSLAGLIAVLLTPSVDGASGFAGVGFTGAGWLWPFVIPVLAGVIAYAATRVAAGRQLKERA